MTTPSTPKEVHDDSPLKGFTPEELKVLGKYIVLTGGAAAVNRIPVDERDLLVNAFKQLEAIAFDRIVAKLKRYAITAAVILTGCGLITLTNLRSAVIDATVAKLAEDSKLRLSVQKDVSDRMDQAEKISQTSRELSSQIERETARVSETVSVELKEMSKMLGILSKRVAETISKAENTGSKSEESKNGDK